MNFSQNISLKPYNTFGLDIQARYYTIIDDVSQLRNLIHHPVFLENRHLVLGGGSNILFTNDFEGLVIHNKIKGIDYRRTGGNKVLVKAKAGEDWEQFVAFCVGLNFGGLENLTLIPGNVGTSPMQNIGAYGVEIKDCFHSLEAFEIATGRIRVFDHQECAFDYRESFFKKEGKGRYIIVSVTFCLNYSHHVLKTEYGTVTDELENMGIKKPEIHHVKNAIMNIRRSKIPDPETLGNAGSFFKNPVVTLQVYERLKSNYPDMPSYRNAERVKVPAAWLIEKAGWKGFREGDAGVHAKQALVLVNYGQAKGSEIIDLSRRIARSVEDRFGITLETEVNIV